MKPPHHASSRTQLHGAEGLVGALEETSGNGVGWNGGGWNGGGNAKE